MRTPMDDAMKAIQKGANWSDGELEQITKGLLILVANDIIKVGEDGKRKTLNPEDYKECIEINDK